jgi:hypothetical protein
MLVCVVLARAQDQARGQGLVVQAGAVGPSHRDEPSDRRGPLWWDAGVLHLPGNQFAQRHGQIKAPIADDARGPEEQSLQFHQLFLRQPDITLVQALLLKFKPANMDVLPLYIVLLAGFPPMLRVLLRAPALVSGPPCCSIS